MRISVVALATGGLVGIIYVLIDVRSPALSAAALVGPFGILTSEQVAPVAKRSLIGEPLYLCWLKTDRVPHVFWLPARSKAVAGEPEVRT
jgi:XapX domain-containing protein